MKIKLTLIHENATKLREVAKDETFQELVDSLHERGLLQPIKVRPSEQGYELIYGHRRFHAMRQLGWDECEAIVEELGDDQAFLEAVTENLQRKDLEPFEEAEIFRRLKENNYTHVQIAKLVNKSHEFVFRRLSLLGLPTELRDIIVSGNTESATTELGAISLDSAAHISTAAASPSEAIQLAQKAISERLTSAEVRKLTSQFRQTTHPEERERILQIPFAAAYPSPISSVNDRGDYTNGDIPYSPSKPFHTADRSVADQFHSKLLWNLNRIDLRQYGHFTIGYSQRRWEQVAELLQLAEVNVLVDARRNAVSQYKPEFSKVNIESAIFSTGIRYWHVPELGIGSEDRADLGETHDYDGLFTTYGERVNSKTLTRTFGDKLNTHRIAFLCVELDPETCHRHRIALLLEEMGYKTLDL
jgi:ParB/RepB/Spo0J family partition protein